MRLRCLPSSVLGPVPVAAVGGDRSKGDHREAAAEVGIVSSFWTATTKEGPGVDNIGGETARGFGARAFYAFRLASRRKRMRLEPESAGRSSRINADLLPPRHLVAKAMGLAMMAPAECTMNSSLTFRPSARCCANRE